MTTIIEKFREKRKQLDNITWDGDEGGVVEFGYKLRRNHEIFTVIDWGNIGKFVSQELENIFLEMEKELRRMGDTSDYPEWGGIAGINVGLIPKEKVISFLSNLKQEYLGKEGE